MPKAKLCSCKDFFFLSFHVCERYGTEIKKPFFLLFSQFCNFDLYIPTLLVVRKIDNLWCLQFYRSLIKHQNIQSLRNRNRRKSLVHLLISSKLPFAASWQWPICIEMAIFSLKFINFSNFQGFFTLLYWQKVGRIGLPFALISLWNLFFSSYYSYQTNDQSDINILFSFLQISTNLAQIDTKKVGISGICWHISKILTDLESAFDSGQSEHLKSIVAWILGTRTFVLISI